MILSRRQLLIGLVCAASVPLLPPLIRKERERVETDAEYWQRLSWDCQKAKYHAQAYGMSDEHFKHWWWHMEMHRRIVQQDRSR